MLCWWVWHFTVKRGREGDRKIERARAREDLIQDVGPVLRVLDLGGPWIWGLGLWVRDSSVPSTLCSEG